MSIFRNKNKSVLLRGNSLPCEFYKGDTKISGFDIRTFSGKNLDIFGTYNSKPEKLRINGGFVPGKNLFDIDAFLSADGNSKYYTINKSGEIVQIAPDYRLNPDLPIFLTLPPGTYTYSVSNPVTEVRILVNNQALSRNTFTLNSEGTVSFKTWAKAGTVIGNIQIEKGTAATQYEAFKKPITPVLCWNQENISVPYTLLKQDAGNDYILMEKGCVSLFSAQNGVYSPLDISDTDFGIKLLSLQTLYPSTSANISEGSLDITVKTFN